ncbi:glycosyltransferase [Oribacterium sp. Sow4_G1_1]|uniref:glycosyltransferase family 2 protein n=1 Tax=Oribacterium sp. Sow4_G1_1 TaxID=3438794 RepID=UPI003F9A1995
MQCCENDKLLTIVVPSYNASKYLDFNLQSFLCPSEPEKLEVIIVDDGSTDDTARIADAYHEKYPDTVKVVHKENGGHGSGINAGLRAATGKYFKVVDADDWVDHEALEKLLDYIASFDAANADTDSDIDAAQVQADVKARARDKAVSCPDVIYNNYYWRLTDEAKSPDAYERKTEFTEPFSGVEYRKVYDFESIADRCYVKMHNMTIRTDILREHQIHIDESCYYVDMEYILYPVPYVETIAFLPEFLYQYQIGRQGQSMDPAKMQRNATQYDHVLASIYAYYDAHCREIKQPNRKKYIDRLISRFYASRIKILLSMPDASRRKNEFITMEEVLYRDYPDIYAANVNKPIRLLRGSKYVLYPLAVTMMQFSSRIS